MKIKRTVLGFRLYAEIARLDNGIDAKILGGSCTHIGAVTLAEANGSMQTLQRDGHKDKAISERWAQQLANTFHTPVCVRCGIHYDHITKEQIAKIVGCCDEMLESLMDLYKGDFEENE